MTDLTDPASELGQIAMTLSTSGSEPGDRYLANKFQVAPWSTAFVKVIACIYERADLVGTIVDKSDLDDDVKADCQKDLTKFNSAFAAQSLYTAWNTAPEGGYTKVQAGSRFKYLQTTVRNQVSYPRLSDSEIESFLTLIDSYLIELDRNDESIVIRQAIRDGLTAFQFQLKYIRWMGAGYALTAFDALLKTFEESRRGFTSNEQWEANAIVQGLCKLIITVGSRMKTTKDYADTAAWAYSGYRLLGDSHVASALLQHLPHLPNV